MDEKPIDKPHRDPAFTRRSFLNIILGSTTATSLVGILSPIIAYVYPTKTGQSSNNAFSDENLDPILAGSIEENSGVVGFLNDQSAIVIKKDDKLFVLSAVCTHLGCAVKWDSQQGVIRCPCHGGKFDLDGKVLSGPPSKGLKSINIKVVNDRILTEET